MTLQNPSFNLKVGKKKKTKETLEQMVLSRPPDLQADNCTNLDLLLGQSDREVVHLWVIVRVLQGSGCRTWLFRPRPSLFCEPELSVSPGQTLIRLDGNLRTVLDRFRLFVH